MHQLCKPPCLSCLCASQRGKAVPWTVRAEAQGRSLPVHQLCKPPSLGSGVGLFFEPLGLSRVLPIISDFVYAPRGPERNPHVNGESPILVVQRSIWGEFWHLFYLEKKKHWQPMMQGRRTGSIENYSSCTGFICSTLSKGCLSPPFRHVPRTVYVKAMQEFKYRCNILIDKNDSKGSGILSF